MFWTTEPGSLAQSGTPQPRMWTAPLISLQAWSHYSTCAPLLFGTCQVVVLHSLSVMDLVQYLSKRWLSVDGGYLVWRTHCPSVLRAYTDTNLHTHMPMFFNYTLRCNQAARCCLDFWNGQVRLLTAACTIFGGISVTAPPPALTPTRYLSSSVLHYRLSLHYTLN